MWTALRLSLLVTATATIFAGILGLALGRLLARQRFFGKAFVETAVLLPLVLPPSVIGYYLLVGMGDRGAVSWLGIDLLFTWPAAAIASAVVGLPLMVQASKAAIASVNPSLEDAARVMGAGEAEVFFRITLPLARRGILAGLVLAAARAFGEFGATLMVAGSIPGRTQTVPLAIYDAVQAGRTTDANALLILTTVLAFASLLVVRLLEQPPPDRRTTGRVPGGGAPGGSEGWP
ncbi:MAG: molybdate ABC transporter permease subunit [Gemmatimonadetes bacterium]|nr:molybdate ABC transporter permease subunit [Gemmatimonadota bacterium]